jgi:hypothetical protein
MALQSTFEQTPLRQCDTTPHRHRTSFVLTAARTITGLFEAAATVGSVPSDQEARTAIGSREGDSEQNVWRMDHLRAKHGRVARFFGAGAYARHSAARTSSQQPEGRGPDTPQVAVLTPPISRYSARVAPPRNQPMLSPRRAERHGEPFEGPPQLRKQIASLIPSLPSALRSQLPGWYPRSLWWRLSPRLQSP